MLSSSRLLLSSFEYVLELNNNDFKELCSLINLRVDDYVSFINEGFVDD